MNEEEYQEAMMDRMKLEQQGLQFNLAHQNPQQDYNDTGIIKEQLSLGEELEIIDNLLESKELVYNPLTKAREWTKPKDEDKIVLSDFGVFHFRQVISGYINKNKLLSNYEEETILDKMKDIATTINDDIFNMYEDIFFKPTTKWCFQQVKEQLEEEVEVKRLTHEIAKVPFNEAKYREEMLKELESKIEARIEEVRKESLKKKIKKMNFLIRFIQDAIHDTYNRAFQGQERRSLRQTMTVTEAKGGFSMGNMPQKKNSLGWWGLNRKA